MTLAVTKKIGNQIWMIENLATRSFRNGEAIPFYTEMHSFLKAGRHHEPACCYYENNPQKGLLYNWFAIHDERCIAPEGFKVPGKGDWEELINFCGGEQKSAIALKSAKDWIEPKDNAPKPELIVEPEIKNGTNRFEFCAKPMGSIVKTELFAKFYGFGSDAYFWTADTNEFYSGYAFNAYMYYYSSAIIILSSPKRLGMSVRCIKML